MDCELPCAETVVLNAMNASKVKSIFVSISSVFLPNKLFPAMIDCGSSHCFLDSRFVEANGFPIISVPVTGYACRLIS